MVSYAHSATVPVYVVVLFLTVSCLLYILLTSRRVYGVYRERLRHTSKSSPAFKSFQKLIDRFSFLAISIVYNCITNIIQCALILANDWGINNSLAIGILEAITYPLFVRNRLFTLSIFVEMISLSKQFGISHRSKVFLAVWTKYYSLLVTATSFLTAIGFILIPAWGPHLSQDDEEKLITATYASAIPVTICPVAVSLVMNGLAKLIDRHQSRMHAVNVAQARVDSDAHSSVMTSPQGGSNNTNGKAFCALTPSPLKSAGFSTGKIILNLFIAWYGVFTLLFWVVSVLASEYIRHHLQLVQSIRLVNGVLLSSLQVAASSFAKSSSSTGDSRGVTSPNPLNGGKLPLAGQVSGQKKSSDNAFASTLNQNKQNSNRTTLPSASFPEAVVLRQPSVGDADNDVTAATPQINQMTHLPFPSHAVDIDNDSNTTDPTNGETQLNQNGD